MKFLFYTKHVLYIMHKYITRDPVKNPTDNIKNHQKTFDRTSIFDNTHINTSDDQHIKIAYLKPCIYNAILSR